MTAADIVVVPVFGRVEVMSWLELRAGIMVGMCSKTVYDREGRITQHSIEPTGATVRMGAPN